jgi:hypothetical protein
LPRLRAAASTSSSSSLLKASEIQPRIRAPASRRAIVDVEAHAFRRNALAKAALREEVAVGLGRRRETVRHAHARLGQLPDHLAERRILAADGLDVRHAQPCEGNCVAGHARSSLVPHLLRSAARQPATRAATANG